MADRAISEEEVDGPFLTKAFASIGDSLVADYRLTGKEAIAIRRDIFQIYLGRDSHRKFKTVQVFSNFQSLARNSEPCHLHEPKNVKPLTLSTTVATADTAQTGPGRIVSLSSDPYYRNFTLGQRNSPTFGPNTCDWKKWSKPEQCP